MNLYKRITANTFLRNFSVLALGDIGGRVINMFTNIILARWLAPERYGEYAIILTYIALFSAIASLGMQFIVNKYVARNQNNSRYYLYISFIWRIAGYLLSILVLFFYHCFTPEPLSNFIIYALLAGVFLDSMWGGLQSVAFGMQRMEWTSILNVSISVFTLISYFCLYPHYLSVETVVIVYLVLYAIKNIAYYVSLSKSHLLTGVASFSCINKNAAITIFKEGFPFYILVVMGLFTNQFPIIFLNHNAGLQDVAFFNTANKLLLPIILFLNTALTALFPNQAILFLKDRNAFFRQVKRILLFLIFLGCSLSLVISLFRDDLVLLLYGPDYKSVGNVMAYQCWYLVMFSIFSLNGSTLGAADRQKLLSIQSIIYAIITTPVLYWFSQYGAEGLAIGYLVSSFINMIIIYSQLIKVSEYRISVKFVMMLFGVFITVFIISFLIPQDISFLYRLLIFSLIMVMNYLIILKYGKDIKRIAEN